MDIKRIFLTLSLIISLPFSIIAPFIYVGFHDWLPGTSFSEIVVFMILSLFYTIIPSGILLAYFNKKNLALLVFVSIPLFNLIILLILLHIG